MTRVVLLDGLREVAPEEPVLRADDLGVVRGEAVFETLRVIDGRPCFLSEHLARMAESARRVDLTLPDGFEELARKIADGAEDAGLRLTMTKGGVGFAVLFDVAADTIAQRQGVTVVTLPLGVPSDVRRTAPWLLGGVKSTSYAVNMASSRAAHARGADDAMWISTDGYVLEAPTSTVVALVDGGLVTPPVETGILPGTTLAACRQLVDIRERALRPEEIEQAALLSSVRGVAPVTALDGRPLPTERVRDLQAVFEESLRG